MKEECTNVPRYILPCVEYIARRYSLVGGTAASCPAHAAVWRTAPAVERDDVPVLDGRVVRGSYGYIDLERTLDELVGEFSG